MRVLIACEFSGIVRTEFENLGHDAWSCDLLPSDKPGNHYQGDVRDILDSKWDLMIAHPPCTYLANSGVRWLISKIAKIGYSPLEDTDLFYNPERWDKMLDAINLFKDLLNAPIPHIAIENPIMHKYAKDRIGQHQSQVIQPHQFGHGETKATCLWLKNLPLLKATNEVSGRYQRVHLLPPGKDRWKLRSMTYQGIAEAMASQWSKYLDTE